MDNEVLIATLHYLLVFRLAVILLGGVCIYLGFRLFRIALPSAETGSEAGAEAGSGTGARNDGGEAGGDGGGRGGATALKARLAGGELSLSGAAPGTVFAAFGALTVAVVLMSSTPGLDYEVQIDPRTGEVTGSKGTLKDPRGQGPTVGTSGGQAGTDPARALTAELWEGYDRILKLARQAVTQAPENAGYRDTLAALLFVGGNTSEAAEAQQKAVELAPDDAGYRRRLVLYRS